MPKPHEAGGEVLEQHQQCIPALAPREGPGVHQDLGCTSTPPALGDSHVLVLFLHL